MPILHTQWFTPAFDRLMPWFVIGTGLIDPHNNTHELLESDDI